MSTPDRQRSAIDEAFEKEEGGSAIDRAFEGDSNPGWLDRILRYRPNFSEAAREMQALGEWAEPRGELLPTPQNLGRQILDIFQGEPEEATVEGAATLGKGILEPASAIAGLATGVIGQGFNNKASDFLMRAAQNLYTKSEQSARDAGMTDEDIAAAHDVGGFLGYAAPIAASIKTAQMVMRTGQALSSHIAAGEMTTDFVAGLIYGGIFTPGEGKERVKAMMAESASFGVTRLLITGALPVMKAMRHKRAFELDASGRISQALDDIENGRPRVISEAEMPGVLQVLEEENYIIHSAAAQDLLRKNAYDVALMQAIKDLAERRGTGGVFKGAARTYEEAISRIERFKAQFPALKFSFPIKRTVKEEIPAFRLTRGPESGEELLPTERQFFWKVEDPDGKEVATINSILFDNGDLRILEIGGAKPGAIGTGDTRALIRNAVKEIERETGVKVTAITGIRETGTHPGVRRIPVKSLGTGDISKVTRERPDTYDIYFGNVGLGSKKLKQLKIEGRFEGQVLQYGDSEVLYVGRGRKAGTLRVKDAEGRVKHVKESNVTDTPFIKEDWEITPEWDALYKDFDSWLRENTKKVARERGGIPESDLVEAIRTGRIQLAEEGRRAFDQGGAIMHPEEIGLTGEHAIQLVEYQPFWTDGVNGQPLDAMSEQEALDNGFQMAMAFLSRSTRPAGSPMAGRSAIQMRNIFGEQTINPTWRRTIVTIEDGRPVGHMSYTTLDEAIADGEVSGFTVKNVVKKYPTGGEISGLISQTATEAANILDPMPVFSFEDLFDIWAQAKGLPSDATDYLAAKASFGDRLRREMWKEVPAADRKIFESIRDEQEKLMADKDIPVEAFAHMKGFSVDRLPEGRVRIRELNTGVSSEFGSELLARKALQKIVRPEVDIPGLIPSKFHGIHAVSGGYPVQDLFTFGDNIQSLETKLDLPYKWIRNIRDWLIAVEEQTGIPLWSQGFDMIDQGKSRYLAEYEPWAKEVLNTWEGISRQRRYAITDFWVEAERRKLDLPGAVAEMRAAGFNAKEINAFRRSRAMFDEWFAMSGIDGSRYIETYYTRIRPFIEANGALDLAKALDGSDVRPVEFQFWAEKARTGDLAMFEKDPELVMHKYIRGLLWDKHIKQHWDRVAVLTGTRTSPPLKIRDLAPDMQERIMRNAAPNTTPDSPVIPKEMRTVLEEYLNVIRGTPGASLETIRSFSTRLFHTLGIKTDPRVLEEFSNTLMSTWYGAAMGLRPAVIARNMSQTIWMLYTRNGAGAIGRGLEASMTREGFQEVWDVGAIRVTEAGVPYGDMIHEQIIDQSAEATKGPLSMALAGAIRRGLRIGSVTRDFAQRTLIPYSSSDQASRAWSYFAQKLHTQDWIERFESGAISWEKFEEQGLPFFSAPILEKFRLTYDYLGKEAALRFIGKMGADEANFIYGVGAQPAWMQSIPGRFVGMFGTWPLWASELYFRRIRNATLPQAAALVARTLALTGAFANMTMQTGIDMWSWVAPASIFGWSGGPAVEHAINAKELISAPLDRKGQAARRMVEAGLRLSFPGQGFYRDLQTAGEQYDPKKAFLSMMLGKPNDLEHWFMSYQADPTGDPLEDMTSPDTADAMRIPWLPDPRAFQYDTIGSAPQQESTSVGERVPAPLDTFLGNIQ